LVSEELKICYKLSDTPRMLEQRMGKTIEIETAREDE
jgi:hypothetical protein